MITTRIVYDRLREFIHAHYADKDKKIAEWIAAWLIKFAFSEKASKFEKKNSLYFWQVHGPRTPNEGINQR